MPSVYRIHPAIGVARLGDSPDEYFLGPEAPYVLPTLSKPDGPPSTTDGSHRDGQGRIKRQGQRFRVYEYDVDGSGQETARREITAAAAAIEWQVHLTNRKAAAVGFGVERRRNEHTPEGRLVIDSALQSISGVSQPRKLLAGHFLDIAAPVALGHMLTDSAGRLIVLGGFGHSASSPADLPIENYANNDGWHDDASDGPVRAIITLKGAKEAVEADPAWLLVAPPKFAPEITNIITLDDVVSDMRATFDSSLAVGDATPVSFTRDIYPILKRTSQMHWLSDMAQRGHGPGERGHFLARLVELSSLAEDHRGARERIYEKLRSPQGGGGNMPKLPASTAKGLIVSLTQLQYDKMRRWAAGRFLADWTGAEPPAVPLDELPISEQPRALDRAILLTTVGAGRYPGIEAGNVMVDASTYDLKRPFRINMGLPPGWLSARMAVPWQADFLDCAYDDELGLDWWPGQRPTHVWRLVNDELQRATWVPETSEWEEYPTMVANWSKLGFILKKTIKDKVQFVEVERQLTD